MNDLDNIREVVFYEVNSSGKSTKFAHLFLNDGTSMSITLKDGEKIAQQIIEHDSKKRTDNCRVRYLSEEDFLATLSSRTNKNVNNNGNIISGKINSKDKSDKVEKESRKKNIISKIKKLVINYPVIGILTLSSILLAGNTVAKKIKPKTKDLTTPSIGCDISEFQKNIDWKELSDNFDFVILRAMKSDGIYNNFEPSGRYDESFEKNYKNAKGNNMKVGVYLNLDILENSSLSIEDFKEKHEQQINMLISQLKGKVIDFPVYLNLDYIDSYHGKDGISVVKQQSLQDVLSKEQVVALTDLFESKVKEAGYIPGIYCNKLDHQYMRECVENMSERFEEWVPGGSQYDKKISFENLTKKDEYDKEKLLNILKSSNGYAVDDSIDTFQLHRYVTGAGAGTDIGYLNINYSMKDYGHAKPGDSDEHLTIIPMAAAGGILYTKILSDETVIDKSRKQSEEKKKVKKKTL